MIDPYATQTSQATGITGKARAAEESTETGEKTTESSDFDALLRGLLVPDQANNVSEEELFAGLVQERIMKLKGEGVSDQYDTILAEKRAALTQPSGFVSSEGATVSVLQALVAQGALTAEEGDRIYSEAFAAAQLDSNSDALFDSRGGPGDATMAMDQLEAALLSARTLVEKLDSGDADVTMRSLASASTDGRGSGVATSGGGAGAGDGGAGAGGVDTSAVTPDGTTVDGENGFLFKPISDNQGTLAVLLPEALAHLVSSVVIKDSLGNVLEEGQSTGYGELGTREKFSFSKTGGEYPSDVVVEAILNDGSTKTWSIPDPSQRYD